MATEVLSREPVLDEFGLLHRGDAWVALSPVQEALLAPLLATPGAPVARATLVEAVWHGDEPTHAMYVAMTRLRAKVGVLGLRIHTIRGRGFLLTVDD